MQEMSVASKAVGSTSCALPGRLLICKREHISLLPRVLEVYPPNKLYKREVGDKNRADVY
jgi:hypothetical protein